MKIIDMLPAGKQFISLEFFPPKDRIEWPEFFQTVETLARLKPLFASVTYGAGGTTHDSTLEIVSRLKGEYGLETMAHLTCIGSEPHDIRLYLDRLQEARIDNVLALRGDLPQEGVLAGSRLRHASDLVEVIRSSHCEIGIAVAGYPEPHPEAVSPSSDLEYLKLKIDNGADIVVTQLFFDNALYFDFVARARSIGIGNPIIPGILPIVSLKVIKRIVTLCGATIPAGLLAQLEAAEQRGGGAAVQEVGIAHARNQAEELLTGGAPGVHLYTLNRAEAVTRIVSGLLGE